MPQNDSIPAALLNAREAVSLLAYGFASENGGEEWREAETARDQRERGIIEQEELNRFSWAKKMIGRAGQAGKIHVHGRRSSHSELRPVPEVDFINRGIDVLEQDGGSLAGVIEDEDGLDLTQLAADYGRAQWMGLRFMRAEIEEMRRKYSWIGTEADQYRTGAAGRPTIAHLILVEFERRFETGEHRHTLVAEANELDGWQQRTHPTAPQLKIGSIMNTIRSRFNELVRGSGRPPRPRAGPPN